MVRRNHPRRRGENTDNPPLSCSQIAFSRVFSGSRPAFPWEKGVCSHSRYTGDTERGQRQSMHSSTCLLCVLQLWQSPKTCLAPRSLCIFCCPVRASQRLSFLLFSSFLSLFPFPSSSRLALSLPRPHLRHLSSSSVSRSGQALTSSWIIVTVSFNC